MTKPGLVYLLMPGVWVWLPTVEDIPNGITWVLNEEDLPVIEAYLQARLVFYQSISASPMDFTLAGWDTYYVDGDARLKAISRHTATTGSSPTYQLASYCGRRLRATIARTRPPSCWIASSMAPFSVMQLATSAKEAPAAIVVQGLAASLKLSSARWQVDRITEDGGAACA